MRMMSIYKRNSTVLKITDARCRTPVIQTTIDSRRDCRLTTPVIQTAIDSRKDYMSNDDCSDVVYIDDSRKDCRRMMTVYKDSRKDCRRMTTVYRQQSTVVLTTVDRLLFHFKDLGT